MDGGFILIDRYYGNAALPKRETKSNEHTLEKVKR